MPDCFGFGDLFNGDVADWNADGQMEFIGERDVMILQNGTPQPVECIAVVSRIEWDGVESTLVRHCIGTSALLISYAQTRFPGSTVETTSVGCRDIDSDGDLDAAVLLVIDGWASSHWVWLENTGYEANDGLAADLNGDGKVDGKDLAATLAAWTG